MRLSTTVRHFSILVMSLLTLSWSSEGQAQSADLSILKSDSPDPVQAGTNLTYTITVNSAGPDTATFVNMDDALPVETTFVSLSSPAGWSCTTPAVGSGGDVSCSLASLPPDLDGLPFIFTVTVLVGAAVPDRTILSNTATVSSETPDPNQGNGSTTATTTVQAAVPVELQSFDVD